MDSLKQYRDAGSTPDQIISCLNQELLQLKSFKEKHDLEFSRYKQDCRKRSLEMAHAEGVRASETIAHAALIKKADDYYKWLISIHQ